MSNSNIIWLYQNYDSKVINKEFNKRYINLDRFYNYLKNNFGKECIEIGKSVKNNSIYRLKIGHGNINVLMWSQMHGNESTGTLAILDLLNYIKQKEAQWLLDNFTITILPILNPDGLLAWDRRTALGVDMNRDFNARQTPEIQMLINEFTNVKYDLALNLHDQRSIFSIGQSKLPATLSFLAPAVDNENSIPVNRKLSMQVIAYIKVMLNSCNFDQIARFSHEFYPNSTGDNFQKMGTPTILFEAGHYQGDYTRQITRKYFFLALITSIEALLRKEELPDISLYETIPPNGQKFYDILYKNVLYKDNLGNSYKIDLALQYKEQYNNELDDIDFFAEVVEIGDLSNYYGHEEVDFTNVNNSILSNLLTLNSRANFKLGEIVFKDGKKIK